MSSSSTYGRSAGCIECCCRHSSSASTSASAPSTSITTTLHPTVGASDLDGSAFVWWDINESSRQLAAAACVRACGDEGSGDGDGDGDGDDHSPTPCSSRCNSVDLPALASPTTSTRRRRSTSSLSSSFVKLALRVRAHRDMAPALALLVGVVLDLIRLVHATAPGDLSGPCSRSQGLSFLRASFSLFFSLNGHKKEKT